MTMLKHFIVAAALSTLVAGPAVAGDTSKPLTMKPNHGISFDIGSKHAVSFFVAEAGACKLAVVMGEAFDGENVPTDTPTRLEVAIDGGKTARVDAEAGRAMDFGCEAGAQEMTVTAVSQVAYSAR